MLIRKKPVFLPVTDNHKIYMWIIRRITDNLEMYKLITDNLLREKLAVFGYWFSKISLTFLSTGHQIVGNIITIMLRLIN